MKLSRALTAFTAALLLCAFSSASTSLDEALDSVRADRIRTDLTFLACDDLAGRDSPSNGLRVAARFIRNRLIRLGFQPGAEDGYFQEYGLQHVTFDWSASSACFEGEEPLRFGRDYFFRARGLEPIDATGPVVFCGGGSAEDFANVSLEGKWALCVESEVRAWRRRQGARDAGALGLIVAPPPGAVSESATERFAHWVDDARAGRLQYPREQREEAGFPWIYLSQGAAARFLPGGDLPAVGTVLPRRFYERRVVTIDPQPVVLENVCGFWPGRDPERSKEVIVLSAHYDHVGVDAQGNIYNGADDNGTGTSGLLALAEALTVLGPLDRSVLLLWVSAEEKGLLGSRAWCEHPWLPEGKRVVADINLDMIGRNDPRQILLTPSHDHEAFNDLSRTVERLAPQEGFTDVGECDDYWRRSDHMNFSETLHVPVVFLFADVHEDYHQPTDTVDKIDFDKVRRVVRLVLRTLVDLDARPVVEDH